MYLVRQVGRIDLDILSVYNYTVEKLNRKLEKENG